MFRTSRWLSPLVFSLLTAVAALPSARAEAPQPRTQVPGYYRQMLGTFEVTALYDGQIMLDTKVLQGATPRQIQAALARMFRTDPTPTAVTAYLVNTGSKLILVDTGAAKLFGPTLGQVLSNLKAAGYEPSQVDAVLITHMHGDHVGGLAAPDGQRVFPNATVYVGKEDADFWLSPESLKKAHDQMKAMIAMAQDATAAYVRAGKLKTFAADTELFSGVRATDEHGHTPGHTGYLFESQGQKLLVWGDVIHNAAVQFPEPKITIQFDSDPSKARAARLKLLDGLAKDHTLVAGAHLPFPGLGHVRSEGKGSYAWVPVDFAPVAEPGTEAAGAASSPASGASNAR